jgi:hypothetical protein
MTNMRMLVAMVAVIVGLAAGNAASAQRPQAPATATAGQVSPNIQVLNDIPNSLVLPTMRVISASLGVECEFCHESNRALNTAKKDVARRMMRMTLDLNRGAFEGRLRVTCYTCHRGSSNPLAAPQPTGQYTSSGVGILLRGNGTPIPGGQDAVLSERFKELEAKAQSASLPTPDQIFAKYVAALGGEQALRRITARRTTATTEAAADVRGVGPAVHALTQQYFRAPNQWIVISQTASATTLTGFDGSVAWRQDAKGVVTETTGAIPAPPLSRVKRTADFYEPLNLKASYSRVDTRGTVQIGTMPAYLVVGVPADDLPEQLFFDVESGLLVRKETAIATAFGDYTIQTNYEDYRDVGGVKVPYIVRVVGVSPADSITTYVERVELNPTVDSARFVKPASK